MLTYNGPKCRLCRAAGVKLFLKGDKCDSPKCPVVVRQSLPGQHGTRRIKLSDFAVHLKEKQKLKKIYRISETQLKKYIDRSMTSVGNTGEVLLSFLERRLDNVLVRAGLACSHNQAHQLILHKHFKVNGKVLDTSSYTVKLGDKITFDSKVSPKEVTIPSWLSLNLIERFLEVASLPKREDISTEIEEQLVVEFYSR